MADSPQGAPGTFLQRDYIPEDPSEQTEAQREYVKLAAEDNTVRVSEDIRPRDFIPDDTAGEVRDMTPEEKQRYAEEAAMRAQERYDAETREAARKRLNDAHEAEAISFIETLGPVNRNIYLEVERENLNRPAIFKRFGQPAEDLIARRSQEHLTVPARFEGPSDDEVIEETERAVAREAAEREAAAEAEREKQEAADAAADAYAEALLANEQDEVDETDTQAEHAEDGVLETESEPDSTVGSDDELPASSEASEDAAVLPTETGSEENENG